MRNDVCPLTSRFITDLYATVPDKYLAKMGEKPLKEWTISMDDFFVEQRMLLCCNYALRVLLPKIFNAEPFTETALSLQGWPQIYDDEGLADAFDSLTGLYPKIHALLDSGLGDTDRERWELAEDIVNSVRWIIEAAMQDSTVVGPLTVNALDLLAGWFGWDEMVPMASALFEEMLNIHLSFN